MPGEHFHISEVDESISNFGDAILFLLLLLIQKFLYLRQSLKSLIRCYILRLLIWVFTVQGPIYIPVILSWAQIGRSAIFGREIGVPDREIFSWQKNIQV